MFNEHFGQGTASLDYVINDMPGPAYAAWWAYFVAYAEQVEVQKAQREHDQTMDAVSRALKPPK